MSSGSSPAAACLPSSIAQAISEMQMPLSAESYLPMHYKSLPEMAQLRRDAPNMPDFVRDVVGTIALIVAGAPSSRSSNNDDNNDSNMDTDNNGTTANTDGNNDTDDHNSDEQEYLARCATALILLGHGGTDEAHDLVSPLSWPNELPFAYGPPVAVSEQVLAIASYVHAMVHRREGPFPSEFGMTGFNNADYWAGSALRSPEGAETLPLEEIRTSILQLAASVQQQSAQAQSVQAEAALSSDAAASAVSPVQQWIQTHFAEQELAFPAFDPRVLNELCSNLQQQQQQQQSSSNAAAATASTTATQPQAASGTTPSTPTATTATPMQQFAEQAVLMEMKILLKHTLKAMGYEV